LIIVERVLPIFNELTGINLSLGAVSSPFGILLLLIITLLTGIIAGSYPALYLSRFQSISILKDHKISSSSFLRNFLVVFQFSISIIMIISTLVVFKQLELIKSQNLGFNKDHVIYITLNQSLSSQIPTLKNEICKSSKITSVAAVSSKLGISQFQSADVNQWEGNFEEKSILLNFIFSDYDFLKTFDIKMADGRFYSKEFVSDSMGLVLNEAAIKDMGLKDPIGKNILNRSHIIGVVNDFNFQSLHTSIEPLAIVMNSRWNRYLAIKIRPQNISETITYIESVVSRFSPGLPFEYQFLDQEFEILYQSENRLGKMFSYFSILAIFISSLGLLGLASYMVERRTKEIGIRKVLGASVSGIFLLLSREFTRWILISNLIAWPVGWYIVNLWLKNFAYKTSLDWWVFLLAGLITGMIALITISSQTIKLALSNPIAALKYE
jgi:putative ABC transport system permease protein